VIGLSRRAEAQIDRLLRHYERLGRVEASRNLLTALETASVQIERDPAVGVPAPRPYPQLARPGRAWVKVGRYWFAYRWHPPLVIAAVFYESADIPRRF
jgi:plasmid stabilization system protein ParE